MSKRVASVGAVAVALVLLWPIQVRAGDHEAHSCGNAVWTDLSRWQNTADGPYRDMALGTCTSRRTGRTALAVGVLALTVLAVTMSRPRP